MKVIDGVLKSCIKMEIETFAIQRKWTDDVQSFKNLEQEIILQSIFTF